MSSVLEKLDSYQLLTNLLPGIFCGLTLKFFFELTLPTQNFGEYLLFYYLIGIVINRIGSLVVEPVLKKIRFIKFIPYPDFAKATTFDTKIDTLSEMNNYTRSLLTCVLLIPAIRIFQILSFKWTWFSLYWEYVVLALFVIIFLFAYRKQTNYVCRRAEAANIHETKEKQTK